MPSSKIPHARRTAISQKKLQEGKWPRLVRPGSVTVNIYRTRRRRSFSTASAIISPDAAFDRTSLIPLERWPKPEESRPNLRTRSMKRILELFATGEYSLSAIQREMTKAGLVGLRSKQPLTFGSIDHILRKHFYSGVFEHKGELHQGSHVPMISKKTFDQIQSVLDSSHCRFGLSASTR